MALVLLKRRLPEDKLVDCLVNTDNVVWVEPWGVLGSSVLIKVLEGPDLIVQGSLKAMQEELNR